MVRRFLFLYATNACGHQVAAQAIRANLHALDPAIETAGIDFFTSHYPNIAPLVSRLYVELMQHMSATWDYIYDSPAVAEHTSEFRRFFNFINQSKIREDIARFKPDAIVCTQAIPSGFVAREKREGKISLPHFAVITDFVAHPYWPDNGVENYFVPHDEIKCNLVERSIAQERIMVTGIPINNSFGVRTPKATARKRLGLSPHVPAVLIMGGSLGLGQIPEAIGELLRCRATLQLLVLPGYNHRLYDVLTESYGNNPGVHVFRHTNTVPALMDAADILISKPGGLTSSEALAKSLPMIILKPLPGQEERNTAFLLRHAVAERCPDIRRLPRIVERMLAQPRTLKKYQRNCAALGRPHAGRAIARHLLKTLS